MLTRKAHSIPVPAVPGGGANPIVIALTRLEKISSHGSCFGRHRETSNRASEPARPASPARFAQAIRPLCLGGRFIAQARRNQPAVENVKRELYGERH